MKVLNKIDDFKAHFCVNVLSKMFSELLKVSFNKKDQLTNDKWQFCQLKKKERGCKLI